MFSYISGLIEEQHDLIMELMKDRDRLDKLFKINWTASYGVDENDEYIEIEFKDRETLDKSLNREE